MADFMKVDMSGSGRLKADLRFRHGRAVRCAGRDTFSKPCGGVRLTNGRVPEEMSPTGDVGLPMLLTKIPQPRPKHAFQHVFPDDRAVGYAFCRTHGADG